MDGAALHARIEPALDHRAVRLDAGDDRAGHLASLAKRGHDHCVVGHVSSRVEPAVLQGQRTQLAELVAAHQARACHLAHGIARAQPHEHLSVLIHLECPASHGATLLSKSPQGRPWLQQASRRLRCPTLAGLRRLRRGRFMPTLHWPEYAGHATAPVGSVLAGLCRIRSGRFMPVGDTVTIAMTSPSKKVS